MPDYPVATGWEIVKALERLGFEQVRQRGSHVIMQRGNRGCSVPLHRPVKRGTLGGIVRLAGINPEDFIAALK